MLEEVEEEHYRAYDFKEAKVHLESWVISIEQRFEDIEQSDNIEHYLGFEGAGRIAREINKVFKPTHWAYTDAKKAKFKEETQWYTAERKLDILLR